MASEGHPEPPKAGDLPLPGYGTWSPKELQAKLAEIGAPTQGSREELVERLKTYSRQVGILLNRPVLRGDDGDSPGPPPLPGQPGDCRPGGQFPDVSSQTPREEEAEEKTKLKEREEETLFRKTVMEKYGGLELTDKEWQLLYNYFQIMTAVENSQQQLQSQASTTDKILDTFFETAEEDFFPK